MNDRIDARALAGEHYIRPDIVEERYLNGLKLLNRYFEKPDSLQLFDNSGTLILMAEGKQGKILILNAPIPEWVEKYLGDRINPKNKEIIKKDFDLDTVEEVRKRYQNSKKDLEKLLPKKSSRDQKKGLLPKKPKRNRKSN